MGTVEIVIGKKTRSARSGLYLLQYNLTEESHKVLYVTKQRLWVAKCNAVSVEDSV
jgi:hypothetical protein